MTKKGYKQTKEHRDKISKNNCRYWKGKKMPEEMKKKLSLSKIGNKNSFGNHVSEETRQKMRISHKDYKPTEETKAKISNSHKGKVFSKEHIENIRKSKEHISNKTRKLMSDARIGKPLSEITKFRMSLSRVGKKFSEKTKKKMRIARAKQIIPIKDTSIEIKIQNFLKQLGVEHYTHFCINGMKNIYQCDIFIPSKKLVIECDGDFWHGNPLIYNQWKDKEYVIKHKERDVFRDKELVEKGFRVIRLWENEIRVMELSEFEDKLNFNMPEGVNE